MIYTTPPEIYKHILDEILIINPPYIMNHLTMQQLEDLGFKLVKSDYCDDFRWQRRKHKKHDIWIETTWKKSGEFHMQEIKCEFINLEILKTILK